MNLRLYDVCASLPDAQRRQDQGAFFGSIHNTLNHILYGDLAFMSRFTQDPDEVPALGVNLHEDFADLQKARTSLDQRIIEWSATLTPVWLGERLTYRSKVDGIERTLPR